jgi:hypothetical protein
MDGGGEHHGTAVNSLSAFIQRPANGMFCGLWDLRSVALSLDAASKHGSDEAQEELIDNASRKLLRDGRCGKIDANLVQQNSGTVNHVVSRMQPR